MMNKTWFALRCAMLAITVRICMIAAVGCAETRDDAATAGPLEVKVTVEDNVINTVKPLIFGDNIEWLHEGMGLWIPSEQKFDEHLVSELREVGVTHLRYPGGALSDRFHWDHAVGDARQEMPNPFADDVPAHPHFGPDEFMALCRQLDIPGTLTLNAGEGTAEQAAAWVKYNREHDFPVTAYAVGNEIWIAGEGDPVRHSPEEYVAIYHRFHDEIDKIAPDVKLGAIGLHDTGGFSLNQYPNWMEVVLKGTGESIDFFDVHNSYAPAARVMPGSTEYPDDDFAEAFLAAPVYVANNFEVTKQDFEKYVPDGGNQIEMHVTEHGPLLYPLRPEKLDADLAWNRNLIAALYQAGIFQVFLREPRITSANHMPLCQNGFGALVAFQGTYPNRQYLRNIVFYVFQMYSRLAGSDVLETKVDAPSYHTVGIIALVPQLRDVPYVDAAAYRSPGSETLSVILINRSVRRDADVQLDVGAAWQPKSVTRLAAESYATENTFADPRQLTPVTTPWEGGKALRLPKHSLAKVDFVRNGGLPY